MKAKPVGAVFTPSHITQVQSIEDLQWYLNHRTPYEAFFNNPPTEQEIIDLKSKHPTANTITKVVLTENPLDTTQTNQQNPNASLSQDMLDGQERYKIGELAQEIKTGWLNMGRPSAANLKYVFKKVDGVWNMLFFLEN